MINAGLKVILGAGEGEEREEHTYYVATEGSDIKADIDVKPYSIADFGVLSSEKNKVSGIWPVRVK